MEVTPAIRPLARAIATLAFALAACASQQGGIDAVWVDAEGQDASQQQIDAARDACYAEVDLELPRSSRRFDHITWGRAMRRCMERRGLILVERAPD